MEKIYKWGIIGPGRIAQKFAAALELVPNSTLHAVASRDEGRARQFTEKHNAAFVYGNYEALANNDEIDAVYIASRILFTMHMQCYVFAIKKRCFAKSQCR